MKYLIAIFFTGSFMILLATSITAQCPKGRNQFNFLNNEGKRKGGTIKYLISENTTFYIKLDDDLNSETFRTGDIVSFTVVEDIYGEFVDYLEKNPIKKNGEEKNGEEMPYIKGDMVKIISKNTKGFGRINYSQRPTLFYVRGKSKIYVIPEYIMLDNGKCIEITLPRANQNELLYPQNVKSCKYQLINGKKMKVDPNIYNAEYTRCVEGRRPKVFNSGIAKAVTAGILAGLNDDNNSDRLSIGSLTLLNEGAGVDGIVDLLTGKNAEISKLLIFEVQLSKPSDLYIEYPPKEDKKEEDK